MLVLSPAELDVAATLLADGAVLGVPTDTVYGLAAVVGDAAAVAALFDVKHRPDAAPIALLCGSVAEAASLATTWSDVAARLAIRFWPGPLTIVVETSKEFASWLGSTRGVGVRVPADPTCLALLGRTGPLAVTSANLHGAPPATTASEVATRFANSAVRAVVDDGPRDGVVSSVLDLSSGTASIVREAAIARHSLLTVISEA